MKVNDNKWYKILVCIHVGQCLYMLLSLLIQISLIDCLLDWMVIGPQNCLFGLNAWVVCKTRTLWTLIGIEYLDLEKWLNCRIGRVKKL